MPRRIWKGWKSAVVSACCPGRGGVVVAVVVGGVVVGGVVVGGVVVFVVDVVVDVMLLFFRCC